MATGHVTVNLSTPYIPPDPNLPKSLSLDYLPEPKLALEEVIWSDDAGDYRTRKWKDCLHVKKEFLTNQSISDVVVLTQGPTNDPNHYYGVCADSYLGYDTSLVYGQSDRLDVGLDTLGNVETGEIPSPSNLDSLMQRSMSTMLPIIKAELSLPNSLYELKDFKPLVKAAYKSMFKLVDPKVMLRKERQGFKKPSLRQLVQKSAGGFLQWKFNLAPIISDIQSIYDALSRTERRINDFITRSGRVQSKHFAYNWNEFPPYISDEPSVLISRLGRTFKFDRRVETLATTFHAEIEYNYNYTQYQVEHARILSLLDAFGVNVNPRILWNAIPWSFVIDWVAGVSRYLDQFKMTNMEPMINIHRYLWSVKRVRSISVGRKVLATTFGLGHYPGSVNQLPVVGWSSYKRVVTMPSISSIESSGLDSTEFTLAAALVLSRRRRRSKQRY